MNWTAVCYQQHSSLNCLLTMPVVWQESQNMSNIVLGIRTWERTVTSPGARSPAKAVLAHAIQSFRHVTSVQLMTNESPGYNDSGSLHPQVWYVKITDHLHRAYHVKLSRWKTTGNLRSSAMPLLHKPTTRTLSGRPCLLLHWTFFRNSLNSYIVDSGSLAVFKSRLKTFLFRKTFTTS